ncbi:MAG: radical SAM protein [Candidatus Pacearchaeota archaeon]
MKQKQINSALEILPPIKKIIKKKPPVMKGYDITNKEIRRAWKQDKPLTLSLYLGAKCNLRCLYCFTRGGILTENNLTEKEYKRIIDEAFELGVRRVMFTGRGEPLLYLPLLKKLLKYIKGKGGWNIVLTNATLMTPKIAKELYNLNCSVMTKINSFNPKIQDELTGFPGSAQKMYLGLSYLMRVGFNKTVPTRLANDNLICKLNYKEIPFMVQWFTSHNIQYILEKTLWMGRAIDNIDKLKITKKEFDELLIELKKKSMDGVGYWSKGTYFSGEECIVDTITIVINERGDVMPCWAREGLAVGNIRNSSLKSLWYNPYLVRLRKEHRKIIELVKKGKMPLRECPGRAYAKELLKKQGFDVSKL